jgi:hypothetical protein
MAHSSLREPVLGRCSDVEVVLWLYSSRRITSFDSEVTVTVVLPLYSSIKGFYIATWLDLES